MAGATQGREVILPRRFYTRPAVDVARDLLGKTLRHGDIAGRIIETEAYPGGDDLASHSRVGITDRTRVIFGPPGHAYVYLVYGMHHCFNVVTAPAGTAGCVLIRALDLEGASGPGRLTRMLGITRAHSGADLTRGPLIVRDGPAVTDFRVTPRIGITKCAERLLRFVAETTRST